MAGLILWSLIVAGGFLTGHWVQGILLACVTILIILRVGQATTSRGRDS